MTVKLSFIVLFYQIIFSITVHCSLRGNVQLHRDVTLLSPTILYCCEWPTTIAAWQIIASWLWVEGNRLFIEPRHSTCLSACMCINMSAYLRCSVLTASLCNALAVSLVPRRFCFDVFTHTTCISISNINAYSASDLFGYGNLFTRKSFDRTLI